jgi:uncharacterized protein YigA (DUF484 family)
MSDCSVLLIELNNQTKGYERLIVDTIESTVEKDISEEDVAKYLKSHSGFFLKRDDLLLELKLSHPSGQAVSLLERQVSLLRERNMDMRNRLGSLVDNATGNDQLFEQTKQLVLALIEAQGLDAIVNTFNRSILSDFDIDYSSLTLFSDPERHRSLAARVVPIDEAFEKIPSLLKSDNTTCGVLRPHELEFLFSGQSTHVKSAAVVPLNFGNLLGVVAIGSNDPNKFRSNMGTLFLDYIAQVLNRVIPRHLKK